eukprot:853787-Rhodomonas_salina.1
MWKRKARIIRYSGDLLLDSGELASPHEICTSVGLGFAPLSARFALAVTNGGLLSGLVLKSRGIQKHGVGTHTRLLRPRGSKFRCGVPIASAIPDY